MMFTVEPTPDPENLTVMQFIIQRLRALVVELKLFDLYPVFGVHINFWQIAISLFVLSMILLYLSGEGEGDD